MGMTTSAALDAWRMELPEAKIAAELPKFS
jgi:hypothetical protein